MTGSAEGTVRRRSRWGFLVVEAFLIIASILAAFAIDAWWSGRQDEARRVELVTAMRADFAATAADLPEAIEEATGHAARTGGYLNVIAMGDESVGRDSLLYLLDGVAHITFFEPSTANYRAAISSGAIDMLRSPELLRALADFDLADANYDQHLELAGQVFYLGAVHDLRVATGGYIIPKPEDIASSKSYRHVVPGDFDLRSDPAVAAAETVYWLHANVLDALVRMSDATDRVVAELDRMLD